MIRGDFGFYTNINTATTTVIKATQGALLGIVINKANAGDVITLFDNTAASGTKIATITLPATLLATQGALPYFCQFLTGLTVLTTGTSDITVVTV